MNKETYIGGTRGGVPIDVFTPGPTRIVEGASSLTRLRVEHLGNQVHIQDITSPKCEFLAYAKKNLFGIKVSNKGWRGMDELTHPDIYPRLLAVQALKSFREQDFQIDGMHDYWQRYSHLRDNYLQYQEYLSQFDPSLITDDVRKEAAANSWTGKLARKHLGFSRVESVTEGSTDVVVIFRPAISEA
jgi:hypothetical protein